MAKLRIDFKDAPGLTPAFVSAAIASGPTSDGLIQLDLLSDILSVSYSEIDVPDDLGKPGETVKFSAVPTFPAEAVKPVRQVVARLKLSKAGAQQLVEVIQNHLAQMSTDIPAGN